MQIPLFTLISRLTLGLLLLLLACKSSQPVASQPTEPAEPVATTEEEIPLDEFTRVSSAEDFLLALKPGARILLATGDYHLSAHRSLTTDHLRWEEVYDGVEAHLSGLEDVVIRGEAEARLLVEPRYAWVLYFDDCEGLSLQNLTFGHEKGGYCTGGVLSFRNSQGITIDSCNLFGSGTEGLLLTAVENFTLRNSRIYECTYDLMSLRACRDIRFENSTFSQTGEFDLVSFSDCRRVAFDGCTFRDNFNGSFMPNFFYIDVNSASIAIRNSSFLNNRVHQFTNRPTTLELVNNTFEGNQFD
jgi:hypothetical protein